MENEIFDCQICGKEKSIAEIDGVNLCFDCYHSMQENDYSDIAKRVALFKPTSIIDFDKIEYVVCCTLNLPPSDIQLKSRKLEIVSARRLCHYFSVEYKLGTLEKIGDHFGGVDHATVLNSRKKVNNYKETDKIYLQQFEDIKRKIEK